MPSFQEGEILEGMLLEQIDPSHAVLRIRGQNLLVENRLPLPRGEALQLQVEEIAPKVILRLLTPPDSEESPLAPILRRNLSADVPTEKLIFWMGQLAKTPLENWPPEIREGVRLLLSFFQPDAFAESGSLKPSQMKEMLLQSGLFLENKLFQLLKGSNPEGSRIRHRDLKSLLLLLKSGIEGLLTRKASGDEASTVRELSQGLDQLLQKIEFFQLMNAQPEDPREKMFFLIPFGFQTQPQFVEVGLFFQPREHREGEKGEETKLLFLLHFPDWGKVKIELKVYDRKLYGQFFLTDPQVADFVAQGFSALTARLAEVGYQGYFQVVHESPERIESSLWEEMVRDSQSVFNIIV
jgi:hypothetical protein